MTEGVLWAIFAGLMLGLYALPEKFTKDFKYENTWSLFFLANHVRNSDNSFYIFD